MAENLISVVDFIRTFRKNPDYGLAFLDMHGRLETILGTEPYPEIKPSIKEISRSQLWCYEHDKDIPLSVQAIERLEKVGVLFPLTMESHLLENLVYLYTIVLLSGDITKNYYVRFNLDQRIATGVINRLSPFSVKRTKGENKYDLAEADTSFGRVLHLIGLPIATAKVTPEYQDNCLDILLKVSDDRRLLNAVCNGFLLTKLTITTEKRRGYERLYLHSQSDEEKAKRFVSKIVLLMQKFIPEIEFPFIIGEKEVDTKNGREKRYIPYSYVNKRKIEALINSQNISPETREVLNNSHITS